MNFDQYRKEMSENYGFSDVFIEAQITYMINNQEEQFRAEERMKERKSDGMEANDILP